MKRIVLILLLSIFFVSPSWAVTMYAKTTGGNWSAASTWSATSSAGVDNAGPPINTTDVIFDAASATLGAVVVDVASVAKTLTVQAGNTGTLTHNNFNLTISGNITFVSTMTYTPTSTSQLVMNASGTLITGTQKLAIFNNSSGTTTLGDNCNTLVNKTSLFLVGSVNMNGFSIIGNSTINRVLIRGGSLGTQGTLTCTADNQFQNADFRDIRFSSAANRDFSAITGNSGDCGGNSIIGGGTTLTFTAPATQTWDGTTANWDTAARWTSRVPLPQDNVVLAGTNTCTANMPRLGKDISFSAACKLTLGNAVTSYGSLDFTNSGIFTTGANSWTFESQTRSGTLQWYTNGKSWYTMNFNTVNTILQLQDSLTSTDQSFLNAGTFDSNDNAVTMGASGVQNTGITRAIDMGSSLWTLSFSSSWSVSSLTAFTMASNTGTILLTSTSAGAKTFTGGGVTAYNNVTISGGAGAGATTISGSNTFNTITVNAPKTVTFTPATTQQMWQFVAIGSSGNVITINTGGAAATLNKTGGGTIQCDWLNITSVNVTPPLTWYYGNNTVWNSGTGWNGGKPPRTNAFIMD